MAAAPFTTPKTWVTGETVQADGSSGLNAQLRDNILVMADHVLGAVTLTSTASTIDFVQIPQAYQSLRIIGTARTDGAVVQTQVNMQVTFDTSTTPAPDTSTNYDTIQFFSLGGGATGAAVAGSTYIQTGHAQGSSAITGDAAVFDVLLHNYASTAFRKAAIAHSFVMTDTSNQMFTQQSAGRWRSTGGIRQIRLYPVSGGFIAGTSVVLVGVRSTSTSS